VKGEHVSKRKKSPLGKKIEFDSFQALADYLNDNLVQVGCEHWTIVPAGNAVHIVRVHSSSTGDGWTVSYGLASLANFKQFVGDLPAGNIDCMSVMLCRDSEKNGSLDLIEWLNGKYKEKDFSLTAHGGERLPSTAEAVRKMRAMVEHMHN
jgi:hypothetical protein